MVDVAPVFPRAEHAQLDRAGWRGKLSATALLVLVPLGVFLAYTSMSTVEMPLRRPGYATLVLWSALLVMFRWRRLKVPSRTAKAMLWWVALLVGYAAISTLQPIIYPGYIAGDAASLLLPMFYLLLAYSAPELFEGRTTAYVLGGLMGLAACVGALSPDYAGRFEPPSVLLITMAWVWLVKSGTGLGKVLSWLCLLAVFALAFESQKRTHVVVFFIAGAVIFIVKRRTGLVIAATVAAVLLVAAYNDLYRPIDFMGMFSDTRFKTLTEGQTDTSVENRYLEAKDAIRTAKDEWTGFQFVTGYGHGATYKPFYSYIDRTVTDDMRNHNIHIGPVLSFFRYGLIGFSIFLWLCFAIFREHIRLRRRRYGPTGPELFYVVGMGMYLLDFCVRNAIVDPGFSLTIAGFLYICRRRTRLGGGKSSPAERRTVVQSLEAC